MRNGRRSTDEPAGRTLPRPTPARPLAPVVDRPRRIDAWIDYFGAGDADHTTIRADARPASRRG
jgi:hypothetical protein